MIRLPTADEERAVVAFFEAWDVGLFPRLLGNRMLAIVEWGGGRFAVLASQALLALPEPIRAQASGAGLAIGVLTEGVFQLDLQGAVEAARHTRERLVRVNLQASKAFLYGKPVLGDSVLGHDQSLKQGSWCVVVDARWEALGIGTVVGNFKGPREAVMAVHDLGTYLRDQDE